MRAHHEGFGRFACCQPSTSLRSAIGTGSQSRRQPACASAKSPLTSGTARRPPVARRPQPQSTAHGPRPTGELSAPKGTAPPPACGCRRGVLRAPADGSHESGVTARVGADRTIADHLTAESRTGARPWPADGYCAPEFSMGVQVSGW
jgi:hypothetical protein